METDIGENLGRNWGWIMLRGVAAVLFGVLAIARPGITLAVLIFMWGAYAIADGILALVAGLQVRGQGRPIWSFFVMGTLGILAGVLTFRAPGLTALALLMVIAGWAIATGLLQIVAAFRLRKVIDGEWALGLSGVLLVIFGILSMIHPGTSALGVLWMVAANAVGFGILLIIAGFRMRSLASHKLAPA